MAEMTAAAVPAAAGDEAGAPDAPTCTPRALTHPSPVIGLRHRSFVLAWFACHRSSPTSPNALSEGCHRSVCSARHCVVPRRRTSIRPSLRPRRPQHPHTSAATTMRCRPPMCGAGIHCDRAGRTPCRTPVTTDSTQPPAAPRLVNPHGSTAEMPGRFRAASDLLLQSGDTYRIEPRAFTA